MAFTALTARYWKAVHRITGSMMRTQSEAAEAAEGTFLFALRSAAFFPSSEPFRIWLYRIAIDQCLLRLQASPHPVEETLAGRGDLEERIRDTLGRVEHLDRASFALRVVEEISAEEAGAILCMAPEEIRERTHRTLLAVTAALGRLRGARHTCRLYECLLDAWARRSETSWLPEQSGRATPSR